MDINILSLLTSVRFDSYKSFNENGPFRLQLDQNITLIIGRNNSGKSSLVDTVEAVLNRVSPETFPEPIVNLCPIFIVDGEHLERGFIKEIFNNKPSYGTDGIANRFLNRRFTVQYTGSGFIPSDNQDDDKVLILHHNNISLYQSWVNCAEKYYHDIKSVKFRRINAERDIVPESENDSEDVDNNGNGTTNLIRKYINIGELDERIIEETILKELNTIMEPDAHFDSIRVQQVGRPSGYKWEVFLEEEGHRYALSKCGSGIKTILLILINLHLISKTKKYLNDIICYAFEEIENNLHPALQRRVFNYLYQYSLENDIRILITSHSHIAINTFYGKSGTRLYHVVKENGHSRLISIETGMQGEEIISDLGVKASDLFQTNGIIWVEGPSDRIYISKWLSVFTDIDNKYIEGQHYQYMYYGGRLLSHYEAEEWENKTIGLINILTTNRHAVIVMDSDKKNRQSQINDTKKRIQKEFEIKGYFSWITKGKEIENYVSKEAVNLTYSSDLPQIKEYEIFPEYIKKYDKTFSTHKNDTARKLCEHITKDNSENILDLKQQITKLYAEIEKWN